MAAPSEDTHLAGGPTRFLHRTIRFGLDLQRDRSVTARVCGYDLAIDSELAIPGAVPLDDAARADVVVRCGRCPLPVAPLLRLGPYRLDGSSLYFEAEGVAVYRCDAGRSITVQPASGADQAMVTGLLIATALPALLWMRGEIVLHAAAVVMPGAERAVAITGPSGAGKSTLLAQALEAGACVVADDTLCVRLLGDACWGSGLPAGYFTVDGGGDRQRTYHPVAADRRRRAMPLAALVMLAGAGDAAAHGPLDAVAGLSALLRARHRPRALAILGKEGIVLQRLAALSAMLPVYPLVSRAEAYASGEDALALLRRASAAR